MSVITELSKQGDASESVWGSALNPWHNSLSGLVPNVAALAEESSLAHLNPNQRQAVCLPLAQPVQIMAGAGTGKTTVMAHRLVAFWLASVRALQQGSIPITDEVLMALAQQALAVTFTVKAAEEMRHRVAQLVATQAKANSEDSAWQWVSRMSVDGADRLWIHHFHGVGRRLLLNHGAIMGWGPGFRVLDAQQHQQDLAKLLEDVQHGRVSDCSDALAHAGFLGLVNTLISPSVLSPQSLATLIPRQLNTVLADAIGLIGRAKSAGLTPLEFFEVMQAQTTDWHGVLNSIPQTDGMHDAEGFSSAQSMAEAFQRQFGPFAHVRWSFLGTPQQREAFMEERLATTKKADPNDWEPFYKEQSKVLTHSVGLMHNGEDESPLGRFDKTKWVPGLSQPERQRLMAGILAEEQAILPVVTALYAVLQYRRYQAQTCDFDDLILHPVQLLRQSAELQALYQQQFSVRVVDEFQDTNGLQLSLVRLLTPSHNPGLMVVGDIKQAIYGFRFAQPENMEQVFLGMQPTPAVLPLTTNYRSSLPVVALANGMAQQLYLPHTEDLTVPEALPETPALPIRDVYFSPSEQREKKVAMSDYHAAEAQWLAQDIGQQINNGLDPSRVAVLVKDHARGQRFAHALQQAGIAVARDKTDGAVWHVPVMRQWVALLSVLANPNDDLAWVTLLQEKLSQAQLRQLARLSVALASEHRKASPSESHQLAKTWPWWQTLQALSDTQRIPTLPIEVRSALLALFESVLATRGDLARNQWQVQGMALAEELGLWPVGSPPPEIDAWLQWQEGLASQSAYRRYTLRQWVQLMVQYREKGEGFAVADASVNHQTPITILTMHAAKGLEYDVVYVSAVDSFRWRASDGWLDMEPRFATGGSGLNSTSKRSAHGALARGFGLYWAKHHRCWGKNSMATLSKRLVDEMWRKPRQQEETRRLVYVALTRARQQLTLMRCPVSPEWTDAGQMLALAKAPAEMLLRVDVPV